LFTFCRTSGKHTATVPAAALVVMFRSIIKEKTGFDVEITLAEAEFVEQIFEAA
jgi:predicted ABC-type ATPase